MKSSGFTLIELIVVIILLGIVGAVVFSRLTRPSTFSVTAARDAIAAAAQAAQQLSLGREDATLTIQASGGEWVVSANAGGASQRSVSFSTGNIILETGATAPSADNCATAFDTPVSDDFELAYDARGNAVQFSNDGTSETVENGVRICVNDSVEFSVCISPAGFAKVGDCDD